MAAAQPLGHHIGVTASSKSSTAAVPPAPWSQRPSRATAYPVPEELATALRDAYLNRSSRDSRALLSLCAEAARAGYAYVAIAQVLGVTKARVSRWIAEGRTYERSMFRIRQVPLNEHIELTAEECDELLALEALAYGGVRGPVGRREQVADARGRYETIVAAAAHRGVIPRTMSLQLGLQYNVLLRRARRAWVNNGASLVDDIAHLGCRTGDGASQVRPSGKQLTSIALPPAEQVDRVGTGASASSSSTATKWAPPRVIAYSPEVVPLGPATEPPPTWIDSRSRVEQTRLHHDCSRRIAAAAQAAGLEIQTAEHGQDAAFIADGTLVNIEIKTMSTGDAVEQFRLGLGQVLLQVRQHRDDLEAGWQCHPGKHVRRVVAVLAAELSGRAGEVAQWDLWVRAAGDVGVYLTSVDALESCIRSRSMWSWPSSE